eukprot:scaffold57978_cov42-Phaeocystis_antarctica.AAC.1
MRGFKRCIGDFEENSTSLEHGGSVGLLKKSKVQPPPVGGSSLGNIQTVQGHTPYPLIPSYQPPPKCFWLVRGRAPETCSVVGAVRPSSVFARLLAVFVKVSQ